MAARGPKRDDLLLGLVPVAVGIIFGLLVLPRRATPDEVPLPIADGRALARTQADDARRAAAPLPGEVRALGSAIRDFHTREAAQDRDPYAAPAAMNDARQAIDRALAQIDPAKRDEALLALRATQADAFVHELRAFERTGNESAELLALAGPFVRRLREVGWCTGHDLPFDDAVARVMFKSEWAALLEVERPPFAPTLDEERVLYAFYLRHPHAPTNVRRKLDEARVATHDAKKCAALDEGERLAAELWRIDKIKKLAPIDPAYPEQFALGVAHYRHGDWQASANAFHAWIDAHEDGRWTIRARHFLREAVFQTGLD